MTAIEAIRLLIDAVNGDEGRRFIVALVGYTIEGQLCPADLLQVDTGSVINLRATAAGFCCFAFFAPNKLTPAIIEANGIQIGPDGIEFVVVLLEVNQQDVWAVFETTGGAQRDLFLDYAARETAVHSMAERLHAAHH